ncbi:MAG TPA: hypothetical protein VGL73_01100 [Caulobacteraceae bacterium]
MAPRGQHLAQFEIELAQRLAETDCPAAALEPRVAPRAYERDGFVVTLWTYYQKRGEVSPAGYAKLEDGHEDQRRKIGGGGRPGFHYPDMDMTPYAEGAAGKD